MELTYFRLTAAFASTSIIKDKNNNIRARNLIVNEGEGEVIVNEGEARVNYRFIEIGSE